MNRKIEELSSLPWQSEAVGECKESSSKIQLWSAGVEAHGGKKELGGREEPWWGERRVAFVN